jgi:trigger factor
MNVTRTAATGLSHEYQITVPATDIQARLQAKLKEVAKEVKMPGFRPGKVPMKLVEQRYATSVLGDLMPEIVNEATRKVIQDNNLRPALDPKIEVTNFQDGHDLEYKMTVELVPDFTPMDFSTLSLERLTAPVADSAIDDALQNIAKTRRNSEVVTEARAAKMGDIVVMNFAGTVDGQAQPGMQADGHQVELGSRSLIDTFEDQLVGAKVGDHRTVTVTFPADYGATQLAGKVAVFEVDVTELRQPVPVTIDEDFAKNLGFESLDKLKDSIRSQIEADYKAASRFKLKRQLMDKLADAHDFPVPPTMLKMEFDAIWDRLQKEMDAGQAEDEKKKTEQELRNEYESIAARRVRLGLLLADVGRTGKVEVTQNELTQAILAEARRFPGQERAVFEFFGKNRAALEQIRAPLFEDKVVDLILAQAKITDKSISSEELFKEVGEE